jgi:hypothetical protein
VDGNGDFEGTDVCVDPAAFCGVAARMLAASGRDAVPAVLALLGQALSADVRLLEAGTTRAAIPAPRVRRAAPDSTGLAGVAPIELPVCARDTILAVLSIAPTDGVLPLAWTAPPGPLATIADLLALTLSAGPGPDAVTDVRSAARTWFDFDEQDRAEQAGQLHDGLVQSLVAARYLLDLAAVTWPGGPQPWLSAVQESLQAALADGRGLMSAVQPRTRNGRGLSSALEDLAEGCPIPVELTIEAGDPAAEDGPPSHEPKGYHGAACYRFVQAAIADLIERGGDAAQVRLAYGSSGVAIDVAAVGDRPAWPDEAGPAIRRWASRIDLLGGATLLQPASAHLRFAAADVDPASLSRDEHAGRTL